MPHRHPTPIDPRSAEPAPRTSRRTCLALAVCLAAFGAIAAARAQESTAPPLLPGRVVAVGLPGAAAIAQVGFFHPDNAAYNDPAWATYHQPQQVLDRRRLLVTSTSNFGAQPARGDFAQGAVLSIDPVGGDVVVIPPDLAVKSRPMTPVETRVQLFTAQARMFMPQGASGDVLPPVSNPLGIAINNGSGLLWFANNTGAGNDPGLQSAVAPTGNIYLLPDPSAEPGGGGPVPMLRRLRAGGVGAVMIGSAVDGGRQSLFAVLTADGALAQVRSDQSALPLAPPGTITPLPLPGPKDAARTLVTRAGMVFNWVPERIVYVSDPIRNTVVALRLVDDGATLRVEGVRRIEAADMNAPVDLAPVVPEGANPRFSSNTSLAGGADFYVLNRGNGIILRMNQAGQTVAARRVTVAGELMWERRLNGLAVSRDAQRLWLTVTGPLPGYPNSPGGVIEVPAFGPSRPAPLTPAQQTALVDRGAELFQTSFTADQGLGPLYNGSSCRECHQFPSLGGAGPDGLTVVYRVGRFSAGAYDPLLGAGGPVSRKHSIGGGCRLTPGIPPLANMISVRNTPSLFGDGLIDAIPDAAIRARVNAVPDVNGVAGRTHNVRDTSGQERVGRFGWKADTATLDEFIAEAMRNEMGLTSPLAAQDIVPIPPGCGLVASPKFDINIVKALSAFVASLPAPTSANAPLNRAGAALFTTLGCASCHTPALPGAGRMIPLYSDLLLHDMGRALDDGVVQGQARGRDWRTTPLWGLGVRVRYLHDGRATSVVGAIAAHDGEAAKAAERYFQLKPDDREKLLSFLNSL